MIISFSFSYIFFNHILWQFCVQNHFSFVPFYHSIIPSQINLFNCTIPTQIRSPMWLFGFEQLDLGTPSKCDLLIEPAKLRVGSEQTHTTLSMVASI